MIKWNTELNCIRGLRHRKQGLECQDQGATLCKENCVAVALADGAGQDSLATSGSAAASAVLVKLLTEKFDRLYSAAQFEPEYFKHNIITNLYRNMRQIFPQAGDSQFQSTLMAVAVYGDRYIYLHLGDGSIFCHRNGIYDIFSGPENGFGKSETFLTFCPSTRSRIRCGSGTFEEIDEFLMLTDGLNVAQKDMDRLDSIFASVNTEDDRGMCRIIRQT